MKKITISNRTKITFFDSTDLAKADPRWAPVQIDKDDYRVCLSRGEAIAIAKEILAEFSPQAF